MFFASDNTGPVHPEVMAALMRANEGYAMPYGAETAMDDVRARVREIFGAPDAEVHLVATGTAANVLLLGTMTQPFETIFCAEAAHIVDSECNAPEFYTGGAKLTLIPTVDGKIMPDALRAAIARIGRKDIHNARRGPLALTQVTEAGSVYTVAEIAALTGIAREHGLPVHMDGARFANALESVWLHPRRADLEGRGRRAQFRRHQERADGRRGDGDLCPQDRPPHDRGHGTAIPAQTRRPSVFQASLPVGAVRGLPHR